MTLYRHAPYEYSATGGGLVFTAGACPLDEDGQIVAPGDLETQAARTVENLISVLTEAGTGPEDLLKTTIYVIGTGIEGLDVALVRPSRGRDRHRR